MRLSTLLGLSTILALGCAGTPPPEPPRPPPVDAAPPPAVDAAPPPAAKGPPRERKDLLARQALFSDPTRWLPTVSPDGKLLAFLGPDGGARNLWVGPVDAKREAAAITKNRARGVRAYAWVGQGSRLVYLEDPVGAGNLRAYAIDAAGGEARALTPETARAEILKVSARRPDEVLLLVNDRDPRAFDVHLWNLRTGKSKVVLENTGGFSRFFADDTLRVRVAERPLANGGKALVEVGAGKPESWKELATFDLTEAASSAPVGFDAGGNMFLVDNRGRDDTALVSLSLRTKKTTIVAELKGADIASVLLDPRGRGEVQAVATVADKREWRALQKPYAQDLELLAKAAQGDMEIVSRSADERVWIVAFRRPDSPTRFFRYDRGIDRKVSMLFSSDRLLETISLQATQPVDIKARDGLRLQGYFTPASSRDATTDAGAPLVVVVHDGPWARDQWALSPWHQLLSSRGYGVVSINFRGSRGFGKPFLNAGNGEWGGKMEDDLVDAVDWAVAKGQTDKSRVAILGEGYGGYAALMGLATRAGTFACAIDVNGPVDLPALVTDGAFWGVSPIELSQRVGDPKVPAGLELLRARSPLTHAGKITKPLLVFEGASVAPASQAAALVEATRKAGGAVTHVTFADEGRAIVREANRLAIATISDVFLAQCLGGAYEPYGDDLNRSGLTVRVGGDAVHRLPAESLKKK